MTDAVDWEDLDNNTFFQVIKSNKVYQEASGNRYHVLIPQMMALAGVSINQKMLSTHVLKPSPYFVGGYQTLDGKEVELNEAEKTITTKDGFKESRTVRILFEELFYNEEMVSFRVMCIDQMLEGGNKMAAEIAATTSTLFTPKRTAKEYVNFLVGFKENVPALRKLNMGMREFKRSYVVVRGYLQDAVYRVDTLCDTAANEMVKANPHYATCRFNKKHMAELSLAIRSYFLSGVYDKLMPDIQKMEEEEDALLTDCLNQATNITATDLGIRVEFQCPLPEAVHSLSQLNNFTTPREKLLCLKDTTSLITSAVDQYLSHFKMKETIAFSTDDLLPLLIYVLIQAKPAFLKSNIVFMQNFQSRHVGSNELGFTLVTFEAAVEYLKSDAVAGKLRARTRSQSTTDATAVEPVPLSKATTIANEILADGTGLGAGEAVEGDGTGSSSNLGSGNINYMPPRRPGMSASEQLFEQPTAVQKNLASLRRHNRTGSAPPPVQRQDLEGSNSSTSDTQRTTQWKNPYADANTGKAATQQALQRASSAASTDSGRAWPGGPPKSSNPFDIGYVEDKEQDKTSLPPSKPYVPAPKRIALSDEKPNDFLAALRDMGDGSSASSGRF